jgi:hypothetical protein
MAMPQSPLGAVKGRPTCCRVVCFGGLWVFSRVGRVFLVWLSSFVGCFRLSFLGPGVSFFVFSQLLQVSFWCFLYRLPVYQGAPLRFFNKSFLTYQKKKKKTFKTPITVCC